MKGQESISGFTLILVIFSGFFVMTTADDITIENVEQNTGDYNTIAKTQLKVEAYEDRMSKELNYSGNIAALRLGNEDGNLAPEREWSSGNVPSFSSLNASFENEIKNIIRSQNDILGCQEPTIESVRTHNPNGIEIDAKLDENNIVCSSDTTIANLSLNSNEIVSENSNNNYLALAKNSSNLATYIDDNLPSDWSGSGSASTSCQSSISDEQKEQADRTAESEARNNAIKASASGMFSDFDSENSLPDWMSAETDSSYEVDYSTNGGEESCGDEDEDKSEYKTESDAEVTRIEFSYNLTQSQEVINSDGDMEKIKFEFNYTKSP